jgi:hypothetical protein
MVLIIVANFQRITKVRKNRTLVNHVGNGDT